MADESGTNSGVKVVVVLSRILNLRVRRKTQKEILLS